MSGFRNFLMRGNLIDLAVAVVVGVAFNNIVQALIKDLITPLISAISGNTGKPKNFSNYTFTLHGSTFMAGDIINAAIAFLVVSAVVYYLLVAPSTKLMALATRNKAAEDRQCPECMSQIPIAAKRCMFCTSEVPPVPAPATPVPTQRRARHGRLASDS
ncbi:MAG TPA: large conductance mechanosensitive channel protein MscL [Streptosporangiaceae bacterium]|jgi:large conductance mechanosensitive channel